MTALAHEGFRHEAFFYAGDDDFVDGTAGFLREGLERGEPALVVVDTRKIELLREALAGEDEGVRYADMRELGQNPARIIPAWRSFVRDHLREDRPVRGVGEPIWAGRSPDELVECHRHESLLNLAFAGSPAWSLLCPYDIGLLDAAVLEEAQRTHPVLADRAGRRESPSYRDLEDVARPFGEPLPEPASQTLEFDLRSTPLAGVRRAVAEAATRSGLDTRRGADLVVAVHELVTNALRHGGGEGTLLVWQERDALVCEVRNRRRIEQPLAGREHPVEGQTGGWGMWLVTHLCDLVQIRAFATYGAVRVRMQLETAGARAA